MQSEGHSSSKKPQVSWDPSRHPSAGHLTFDYHQFLMLRSVESAGSHLLRRHAGLLKTANLG